MINNILINTVVPVLFAYGAHHKEQQRKETALQWLMEINAENNTITNNWKQRNVPNVSAFDSQALLELKKNYCDVQKCLECAVGNRLMRE